ncbi:MAG: DoxX family protein [Rhodoferax sp.]|uniref:DoxX family protein n=1 Tax=Rhodoferax sp. TaxID=50421 RepID=UPI00271AF9EE|nr:DoxX family protein [Rhodoferax sp.]MDO8449455.1 DoxX family protein [Rhodoferax sp.]
MNLGGGQAPANSKKIHPVHLFSRNPIMSTSIQNGLSLAARVLLAALFLPAGISKLTGFSGTVGYISSVGLPLPTVAAALALIVEIGGGLALFAGFGTRFAALALATFTLVASFFFHAYWAVPADQAFVTQLLFFKNIAVVGGLLALAAHGAGGWSLDSRRE